jgi:hypothetical protein
MSKLSEPQLEIICLFVTEKILKKNQLNDNVADVETFDKEIETTQGNTSVFAKGSSTLFDIDTMLSKSISDVSNH